MNSKLKKNIIDAIIMVMCVVTITFSCLYMFKVISTIFAVISMMTGLTIVMFCYYVRARIYAQQKKIIRLFLILFLVVLTVAITSIVLVCIR